MGTHLFGSPCIYAIY